MDLNLYLSPVSLKKPVIHYLDEEDTFCSNIYIHTPNTPINDISSFQTAIIGVCENQNAINTNTDKAPDSIREYLYQLSAIKSKNKIIDLGNFIGGNDVNHTILGLRDIFEYVLSKNIVLVIIGGPHYITYSSYLAYKALKKKINIVTVDAKIDYSSRESDTINADNFVNKIIHDPDAPLHLFDYSNFGHQLYYMTEKHLSLLEKFPGTSLRLGELRGNIQETEPTLRDANILSIDVNAIRQSDAPANNRPSPNGINADEICQLTRYAGFSDTISSFGIYELNPLKDINAITSHLCAQMIWYFIEGLSQRVVEINKLETMKKFIVNLDQLTNKELFFYKSSLTDRWWMEIPCMENTTSVIISCTPEDYQVACKNEIPERWLKAYNKLN